MNFAGMREPVAWVRKPSSGALEQAPGVRQARWVGLALAAWAAAWVAILSWTSLSPPVDNAEQLAWVRFLAWGYYKHPPLPTLLLWPFTQVFGIHGWVAALAGGVFVTLTMLVTWRLSCEVLGPHRAGVATLGTLCVTYYSGRTNYYNHNVVLMLFVVVAAWFCWQAFSKRSTRAWLLLGLMLGLGALSKYQVALAFLSLFSFWFSQRGWRQPIHRRGLLTAIGIAGLVCAPHLAWLFTHQFAPVRYAASGSLGAGLSAGERVFHSINWLADQIGRLAPALLLGAGVWAWQRRDASAVDPHSPGGERRDGAAAHFLFAWGALPFLAVTFIGLVTGADLQIQWGTAFAPFTCAWLVTLVAKDAWERVRWRHALIGFALVQGLLLIVNWVTSPMGPSLTSVRHNRSFPAQAIADAIGAPARAALGGPIRVIAGPARYAETLALRLPERPRILIDGRLDRSPWFRARQLAGQPILWVGTLADLPAGGTPPQSLPEGLWWTVCEWTQPAP